MSSSSSKKRKIGEVIATAPATKYYAVKAGHTPGVYTTWADCQKYTTGFRGALFKAFPTEQEARDYVAGKSMPGGPSKSKSAGTVTRFYGVAVGHNPGVYEDWAEVQEQITGVKGPKYKRFSKREEAEEFVRNSGRILTVSVPAQAAAAEVDQDPDADEHTTKRARASSESAPTSTSKSKAVKVYTDGSARGNGRLGAFAGVGVFFGDGDPRNVSEPLEGDPQTNQRAELTAIQRALEIVPRDRDIQIITDSNYAINCCDVWYRSWLRNNWKTSSGGPVLNKDLIVAIREIMDERSGNGTLTSFQWIKGHSADPGNEAADKLAVAGAFVGRS